MKRTRSRPTRASSPARPAKTHFVPKVIFSATFAGVIPVCATGCGGSSTAISVANVAYGDASSDAARQPGPDTGVDFVVACAIGCTVASTFVPDAGPAGPDAGAGHDAAGPHDAAASPDAHMVITVACIGYGGGPCGVGVSAFDASTDSGGLQGVAVDAFAPEPKDADDRDRIAIDAGHFLGVAKLSFGDGG